LPQDARWAELAATARLRSRARAFLWNLRIEAQPGRIPATDTFLQALALFLDRRCRPHGRTIADVRSLFEVMADRTQAMRSPLPFHRARTVRRVARHAHRILESDALGVATAETRAAVERAAKSLGERGFTVEPSGWMTRLRA